jgi:hypothetical protein
VRYDYKVLPRATPHPGFPAEKSSWAPILPIRLSYGHGKQTPRIEALIDSGAADCQAMELSGIRVDRMDRTIGAYQQSGLLMKSGFGKGGKYRLTMTGLQRAERLAKQLADQLA